MTYKIKIILLLISLMASKSFAQITTTINNIFVNNQSNVTNCNLIDIGTTSSNNLVINFRITKPTAQANMAGIVKIYLNSPVGTSGSYTIGGEFIVQSSMWLDNGNGITSVIGTVSCNFDSSAIRVTGSSVNIGFVIGSNAPTSSCSYPLQKTQLPEFNLSPTNVSIPCGTAQATTFTVANVYSSPGTLTYSWNAYGWIRNGSVVNSPFTTTTNTITLTPASATSLPSIVSVQTNLNSVSQGTKNCTVSRPTFTSAATISGNNLCNFSVTYTVSPANQPVNSWSLSNNLLATISNPTASSVTLTPSGSGIGQVTLFANITNSCGQTGTISKVLNVGAPNFPSGSNVVGPTSVGFNQYVNFSYSGLNPTGGSNSYWSIDAPINDSNLACNWQIVSGQGTNSILVKTSCQNSTAVIRLNSNNGCGTSYRYLYVTSSQGVPCNNSILNRRSNNGSYESVIPIPCTGTDSNARVYDSLIISAELYDLNGIKIREYKTNDYDVSNVEKGIYILKVEADNQIITTKIVVE